MLVPKRLQQSGRCPKSSSHLARPTSIRRVRTLSKSQPWDTEGQIPAAPKVAPRLDAVGFRHGRHRHDRQRTALRHPAITGDSAKAIRGRYSARQRGASRAPRGAACRTSARSPRAIQLLQHYPGQGRHPADFRFEPQRDLYFVPVRVRVLYHHSLNVGSAHPPHTQGKVQSAVSFALSGTYRLQTEALIGFMERQTTSNLPSGLSLPIMAGLER